MRRPTRALLYLLGILLAVAVVTALAANGVAPILHGHSTTV
jgi:hypothetical protein